MEAEVEVRQQDHAHRDGEVLHYIALCDDEGDDGDDYHRRGPTKARDEGVSLPQDGHEVAAVGG
jgi:hypothetical protein